MRSLVVLTLFLCLLFGPVADADPLDSYLPKSGALLGKAMELTSSAEDQRIAAKFQQATQKDPAWFRTYAAKVKDGDPLPYHPRLGVTKAEYDRLINTKLSLAEKGAVSIELKTDAQGGLELSADGLASALNGVRLPPGQKSAETPHGKLTVYTEISQDNPESPLGRWKGVQWKNDGTSAPVVTLAVGRRQKTGDGILYYNVSEGINQQTLIVVYRLN